MTAETPTGHLLFVDDEPGMREMVKIVLENVGHVVDVAADGVEALALLQENNYDLVIHDLRMPEMDGIELLGRIKEINKDLPVVVLTAFSSWDDAVQAMRLGAYDYLKKPFDNGDLRALVERAISFRRMRDATKDTGRYRMISGLRLIGTTPGIQEVMTLIRRVAATDSTVVISGDSGTGKEMVARMLHLQSHRREGPFISVNCGAFSETLLESEIFGHLKGSFTGALAEKKGLLALADGGTFFLDELGEMTQATQIKFLRVLENREFMPVGETKLQRVDVRFIAATNRDLDAMVESGTFREDLFFRLNVIPISLPSLVERRDDIPLLAGHFLAIFAKSLNRELNGFTLGAMDALVHRDWPGNIRELQNTIQRAATLATGNEITEADLAPPRSRSGRLASVRTATAATTVALATETSRSEVSPSAGHFLPAAGFDLDQEMARIEASLISQALERTDGNLTQAAKILGISFRSIRYKVQKLGIEK